MYKNKLYFFGITTGIIVAFALLSIIVSAQLNRNNLKQSNTAQSLLFEHERLSGTSYRLFKQLTDEVILGRSANQFKIRNKRVLIGESFAKIKQLELEQREALGVQSTLGSIEDTEQLRANIDNIIDGFNVVIEHSNDQAIDQKALLSELLEVSIDDEFRELINSAINRQSRVVASINSQINTFNTVMVWCAVGFGLLSFSLIIYGCYWLFNQLYYPINILGQATQRVAMGEYDRPINESLDLEFNELSTSINKLASKLGSHEEYEKQSRIALEHKVEMRTSELTKLNHKLTKIDAKRRQFIADISHELRTPLTIIRGEAQVTMRMKNASTPEYKDTLTAILDQAIKLSNLVDDLLFLTRSEANQVKLDLSNTNIANLISNEVEMWQKRVKSRTIELNIQSNFEHLNSLVDKTRIQQVLSILIDNANKYSRLEESIIIDLKESSGNFVISVEDQGDGISAAEVDNIFERFVRFSRHKEGMGLGLPIAKSIVEAHDGDIQVSSYKGTGSTFNVIIPIKRIA